MLWTASPPARECHAGAVKALTIQRGLRRLFDELADVAGELARSQWKRLQNYIAISIRYEMSGAPKIQQIQGLGRGEILDEQGRCHALVS
jgi:hypothetical protein